jgi:hypothetical protein
VSLLSKQQYGHRFEKACSAYASALLLSPNPPPAGIRTRKARTNSATPGPSFFLLARNPTLTISQKKKPVQRIATNNMPSTTIASTHFLPESFSPDENNVIIGRGKKCVEHSGNRRLRAIVKNQLEVYQQADKPSKSEILMQILEELRGDNDLCFVKHDPSTGDSLLWRMPLPESASPKHSETNSMENTDPASATRLSNAWK